MSGLGTALIFGLGAGLIFGLRAGPGPGLAAGLTTCLGAGFMLGFRPGLVTVPGDPAAAGSPRAVLTRDQQAALLLMLGPGLGFGLVAGLGFGLVYGPASGFIWGFGGLGVGLGGGLLASWTKTAWPSYMLTRGSLALRHRLPWSLMSFLADAHRRGVLRQAGAVYQFRHIDLQHRLATRP
jgi:hypothetical protein